MLKKFTAAVFLAALSISSGFAAPNSEDANASSAQAQPQKSFASRLGESIGQASNRASELVMNSFSALDVPYRLGGTSRDTGFDCSGFVRAMFEQTAGLLLPRRAAEQAAALSAAKITTFDTLNADRAEAFPVLAAAKLAQAGASMAEILAEAEKVRAESYTFLSFTSLDNMVAGGRLSKTSGIIGNLLNIKVGATVDETGSVEVLAKGRGMKAIAKFNDSVIEKMQSYDEVEAIGISHAGVPEVAEKMAARLNAIWPDIKIEVTNTTPIVSTHTGIGALAILFQAH